MKTYKKNISILFLSIALSGVTHAETAADWYRSELKNSQNMESKCNLEELNSLDGKISLECGKYRVPAFLQKQFHMDSQEKYVRVFGPYALSNRWDEIPFTPEQVALVNDREDFCRTAIKKRSSAIKESVAASRAAPIYKAASSWSFQVEQGGEQVRQAILQAPYSCLWVSDLKEIQKKSNIKPNAYELEK